MLTRTVRAHAVLATASAPLAMKLEVIESVEPACGDHVHRAAFPTIAAGRAALRYELLAAKSDTAVPAVTGFDTDRCLIGKHSSSVHPERSEGSPVAQRFKISGPEHNVIRFDFARR